MVWHDSDNMEDPKASAASERVPISVLAPDPRNPRHIGDGALAGLTVSTETFGDLGGIVMNLATGHLVSGHQRVKALAGAGAVDFVKTDEHAGYIEHPKTGEQFAVRFVQWDETKERLGNLAANNPHIQGAFTDDAIDQLREVEDAAEFQSLQLDALLAQLNADGVDTGGDGGGVGDQDSVPEPPKEPVTKPGDVCRLGDHVLVCGDSTKADTFDAAMGEGMADCVFTDPPYGVDYVGKTKDKLAVQNDGVDALPGIINAALGEALKRSRPGAPWYCCSPAGCNVKVFVDCLVALGVYRQMLVWVKDSMVLGHSDFHYQHEPVFYGWAPGAAHRSPPDRKQTSLWEFARPKASREHPTMKPLELVGHAIGLSTTKGHVVLDPFGGSGTTLLACERLGRKCRTIEVSPAYCDVIIARWEAETGRKAERSNA